VDPQLSVSCIGSRAYHPAMEVLAPQVTGKHVLGVVGTLVGVVGTRALGGLLSMARHIVATALPPPCQTTCRFHAFITKHGPGDIPATPTPTAHASY